MPDNPVAEEEYEKLKACAGKEKTQTTSLLLYLSKILNVQQLCDFYSIVYDLQTEYGAFMSNDDNLEFGKVYNKAIDEFKKRKISFDVYKEIVNNELNKRALPENAEMLIYIVMSLLLNQDKSLIYNVLQQNIISAQVESGDYYPF